MFWSLVLGLRTEENQFSESTELRHDSAESTEFRRFSPRRDREGGWGREEIERGDGEKKESSLLVYKCDRGNGGLCPANGDGDRSPEFFPSSSSLKSTI